MTMGFCAHIAFHQPGFGCKRKKLLSYLKSRPDVEELGYGKGDHLKFQKDDGTLITVPTGGSKDVPTGLLGQIARCLETNAHKLKQLVNNS